MIRYNKIQKIIEIIKECSAIALKFYAQKNVEVFKKNDNSPVTKADLEISKIATTKLSKIFPNDKIISEEKITNLKKLFIEEVRD